MSTAIIKKSQPIVPDIKVQQKGTEYLIKQATAYILKNEYEKNVTQVLECKKYLGFGGRNVTRWNTFFACLKEAFFKIGINLIKYDDKIFPVPKEMSKTLFKALEEEDQEKHGFLSLVLLTIFMIENGSSTKIQVTEENLYKSLGKLKMDETFGNFRNVKKMIDKPFGEFIKQGWITCKKSKEAQLQIKNIYVYEWGARAKASVNAMQLLEMHCQIDETTPENWQQQLNAAKEYENERNKIFRADLIEGIEANID